jgi:hypothetical protein
MRLARSSARASTKSGWKRASVGDAHRVLELRAVLVGVQQRAGGVLEDPERHA